MSVTASELKFLNLKSTEWLRWSSVSRRRVNSSSRTSIVTSLLAISCVMYVTSKPQLTFFSCYNFQEYIISKICIDSAAAARAVVKSYYDSYLEREYTSLNKDDHDELYSSFCRRVTPGQDEVASIHLWMIVTSSFQNAFTANMTRFNNLTLDRMKNDIRSAFSILDWRHRAAKTRVSRQVRPPFQ